MLKYEQHFKLINQVCYHQNTTSYKAEFNKFPLFDDDKLIDHINPDQEINSGYNHLSMKEKYVPDVNYPFRVIKTAWSI